MQQEVSLQDEISEEEFPLSSVSDTADRLTPGRFSPITRKFLEGFYEDFLFGKVIGRTRSALERLLRVMVLEGRHQAEQVEFQPYKLLRKLHQPLAVPSLREKMLQAQSPQDIIQYTENELDALLDYGIRDGMREEFLNNI